MSSLPLFRLPLVPLRVILNMIDLIDKICLSLCSKKTCRIVRTIGGKVLSVASLSVEQIDSLNVLENIQLLLIEVYNDPDEFYQNYQRLMKIKITDDLKFSFEVYVINSPVQISFNIQADYQQNRWGLRTEGYLEIDEANVPVFMTTDRNDKIKRKMHTFWTSKAGGFRMIVDYFIRNFKPQVTMEIEGGSQPDYSDNLKSVVNWTSLNKYTIESCTVDMFGNLSVEDYKFIMDNVNNTTSLIFCGRQSCGFRHDPQIKAHSFILSGAHWFTLDNLLMSKCPDIDISGSRLTTNQLKKYFTTNLMKWAAGELSFFKRVKVAGEKVIDYDIILQEVLSTAQQEKGGYKIAKQTVDAVYIRRNDGATLKIKTPHPSTTFEMLIPSLITFNRITFSRK